MEGDDLDFLLGEEEAKLTNFNVVSGPNTNDNITGADNFFAVVAFRGGVDIVQCKR